MGKRKNSFLKSSPSNRAAGVESVFRGEPRKPKLQDNSGGSPNAMSITVKGQTMRGKQAEQFLQKVKEARLKKKRKEADKSSKGE